MGRRAIAARVRAAWGKAEFALGPLPRIVVIVGAIATLAGVCEAGVLALVAQLGYAMAQQDTSAAISLGPLKGEVAVPHLLGLALVFAALRVGLQWLLAFYTVRTAADALSRLRRKLFHAYSEAAWSVQARDGEGHLQEMMTAHARSATQAAMIVAGAVSPLSSFVVLVALAVMIGPAIALTVTVASVGIFLLLRPFGRMTRRHATVHSDASLSLAEGAGEAVRLTEEMHVYGTAPQHRRRVDQLVDMAEGPFFRSQLLSTGVPALYQGLALMLLIGGLGLLYALGTANLGSLGAIVLIMVRALAYGQQLQGIYQKLNDVAPFLTRIIKEVDRYAASTPAPGREPMPVRPELAFDRVSFAYDSRQTVLEEVSFSVAAGETIGIVGSSGAGKSTLVQLLLRLRDPDGGTFRVGSIDARQIAWDAWQRRVAYVSQEPRLLSGTVADNIRYFRDHVSDEDVEAAARMAQIHDEVMAWPGGYDHRVGQRVDAVSGGQRQRLCLARALAGRPEILVLDEPTSALDPRSEVAIQQSLEGLHGSVTLFIVAHRMTTLATCDRIMVVESGRIGAFDTPENLRRVEGYFRAATALAATGAAADRA